MSGVNLPFKSEGDEFRLNVEFHAVDGVTVAIWQWNDEEWETLYDRRIIADDLEESINIALYGSEAFVEDDVEYLSATLAGRVRKRLAD